MVRVGPPLSESGPSCGSAKVMPSVHGVSFVPFGRVAGHWRLFAPRSIVRMQLWPLYGPAAALFEKIVFSRLTVPSSL